MLRCLGCEIAALQMKIVLLVIFGSSCDCMFYDMQLARVRGKAALIALTAVDLLAFIAKR